MCALCLRRVHCWSWMICSAFAIDPVGSSRLGSHRSNRVFRSLHLRICRSASIFVSKFLGELETHRVYRPSRMESYMVAYVAIDQDLLERAVQVGAERTAEAVVAMALQEFISRRGQRRIADLFGRLEWVDSLDYRDVRTGGR